MRDADTQGFVERGESVLPVTLERSDIPGERLLHCGEVGQTEFLVDTLHPADRIRLQIVEGDFAESVFGDSRLLLEEGVVDR